ncbi:MAG TPA: hypothetical protein VGM32_12490 [Rhodopila sp.]
MTASNKTPNVSSGADIDNIPQPEATSGGNAPSSALPRPTSSQTEIADGGRIKVGGGYRPPLNK